jgi:hypothetical protein
MVIINLRIKASHGFSDHAVTQSPLSSPAHHINGQLIGRASFGSYEWAGDYIGGSLVTKHAIRRLNLMQRNQLKRLGEMDPLSVATGVFSLLAVCIRTGTILKDFYDNAAIADTKVKGLLTEVESFTQVLRLMKDTLEQENIKASFQATGHIGNHLNNLV